MWIFCGGMPRSGSTLQFQLTAHLVELAGLGMRVDWVRAAEFPKLREKYAARGGWKVLKTHACTPAMQAWKASEERAWLTLPKRVRERGILAVTFEDAVASPSDLGRLLMRLRAEAGAYFRKIVLASDRSALLPQPPCEKDSAAGRIRGGHAGMLEAVAAGPLR